MADLSGITHNGRWDFVCAPEGTAHLKDGLMPHTKQPEWTPTSLAVAGRDWRSSQGRHGADRKSVHLYRAPLLPITLGVEPAANVVSVQRWQEDTRDWRKLTAQSKDSEALCNTPSATSRGR